MDRRRDALADTMEGMDSCCFGLILGLIVIGIPRLVLSPLFRLATGQTQLAQFRTLDLASLVWLLSIALGTANLLERRDYWGYPWPNYYPNNDGYRLLMACGCLLAVCLWWIGIRTVNAARLQSPLQRVLVSALVVPFTYAGTAFLFCPVWLAPLGAESIGLGIFAFVSVAAGIVVCRYAAVRIANRAQSSGIERRSPQDHEHLLVFVVLLITAAAMALVGSPIFLP